MTAIYRSVAAQVAVEASYRALLDRWPVARTARHLPTRQGDTFVISCGPDTAPDLMLFHGAIGNSASWMAEIAQYARHFRCHAVDMIGEPGLSAPSRPDHATAAHADWLDDVLAGLGITRTALVGLSLGGWLALDYAMRRPARVGAVALIAPGGIGRTRHILFRALPYLLLGRRGEARLMERIVGPRPANLSDTGQAFFAHMDLVRRAFLPRRSLPLFSDAQLRSLAMPVLAIVGGRDIVIDTEGTRRRLAANLPRAEVDFRPDGLHFIPDTAPEVIAFLDRVRAATG